METPPPPARPPRPPLTYRKLFRWGLVFWVLVWLASVCTWQIIGIGMKGGSGLTIQFGNGAVSMTPSRGRPLMFVSTVYHEEIWNSGSLRLIREYPEILIAKLAKFGLRHGNYATAVSFPTAGFLWLWLAVGLYWEIQLLRHPAKLPEGISGITTGSRKRVVAIVAAMFALICVIGEADRVSRQANEARQCSVNILTMCSGLSNLPLKSPLSWDRYVSEGKMFPKDSLKCPSGGAYKFSPVMPCHGKHAVECLREDHRRYLAGIED